MTYRIDSRVLPTSEPLVTTLGEEWALRNAADDPDGGVPHGAALRRFAEALVTGSPELASARSALCRAVGPERTAHAAGIVASFDGINRVADATGIRLDAASEARAGDLIETLELTELGRARGR